MATHSIRSIVLLAALWGGAGLWDKKCLDTENHVHLLGAAQALAASEPTTPYVTASEVSVRSGPGTYYQTITTIKAGTKVNVAGREGEWLKIVSKQGNPPGYILERFARPLEDKPEAGAASLEGTYITTAQVNVRSGPGTQYDVIATIPKDTKVQVVGAEGDWLRVQSKHGKPSGYISGRYAQRY